MATTRAARLTQDQNSNVDVDGSLVRGKKNGSKAQKKVGGRKAINYDISKCVKPSAVRPSIKDFTPISFGDHTKCSNRHAHKNVADLYYLRAKRDGHVSLAKLMGVEEPGLDFEIEKQPKLSEKQPITYQNNGVDEVMYLKRYTALHCELMPEPVFETEKQPELSEKQPTDQNNAYKLFMELAALDCELIPSDGET